MYNDKQKLQYQTFKKMLWIYFKNGLGKLRKDILVQIILIFFNVVIFIMWKESVVDDKSYSVLNLAIITNYLGCLSYIGIGVIGTIGLILFFGMPKGGFKTTNEFQRIGLVNRAGEPPFVLDVQKKSGNTLIYKFDGAGIPVSEWEDKQAYIEAILNVNVIKVKNGKDNRTVLLYTVPGNSGLSECLDWDSAYSVEENSKVILGKGLSGFITADFSKTPHILIGGSTGSGKTVLLKSLLMQCIEKEYQVVIADFKGGVDFPKSWQRKCKVVFDEDSLIGVLNDCIVELNARKKAFKGADCANIDDYNRKTNSSLRRYIFSCDEVAELLDKSGLNKEQRSKIEKIEGSLSTIARQGRAFGIHLILATQRPDANVLSGQIKNNIDYRVCGRADNVLSQIILDSTAAAEKIPKDIPGRFILYDGTVFQGFRIDEDKL